MEMKLELVPVPVRDIDRSMAFYTEKLGFALDVDVSPSPGVRVVQLTPPGSACSIVISTAEAREELLGRGVAVGDLSPVGGGVTYAWMSDPDGNTLTLQQMDWRTGDAF